MLVVQLSRAGCCGGGVRGGGMYRIRVHFRWIVDGFLCRLRGGGFGGGFVLPGSSLLDGMLGWRPSLAGGLLRNIHGLGIPTFRRRFVVLWMAWESCFGRRHVWNEFPGLVGGDIARLV